MIFPNQKPFVCLSVTLCLNSHASHLCLNVSGVLIAQHSRSVTSSAYCLFYSEYHLKKTFPDVRYKSTVCFVVIFIRLLLKKFNMTNSCSNIPVAQQLLKVDMQFSVLRRHHIITWCSVMAKLIPCTFMISESTKLFATKIPFFLCPSLAKYK